MRKLKLTTLFVGPSLFSGLVVVLGAILLLLAANYSYLLRSGLIYDLAFGQGTPYDLIQSSKDTISTFSRTILSNPLLNKFLFFAFWMMVGLFVYIIITTIGQSVAEAEEGLESLGYVHARKTAIEQNLILRVAIRLSGLLAAVIYTWVFIRLFLPFSIFASRIGLGDLSHFSGWGYLLLGLVVLVLALHAFIILARFIALRPRVFGGWDSLGQA